MEFVLLTDNDDHTMLVACPDEDTAEKVGSAAIHADGGVSAWRLPESAVFKDHEQLIERLQAGESISDITGDFRKAFRPLTADVKTGGFLVIGGHYWGYGSTLIGAKANFRAQGGTLADGYSVLTFDQDTTFSGVDQMGYIHYAGNKPVEKEFPPKENR